jgi:NAD(P) transhydrogenase subunit alpha
MKIVIPKEIRDKETRVAGTPDTVKKLVGFGFDVCVEKGAGSDASFLDEDYKAAGAKISSTPEELYKDADIVLKIQSPMTKDEGTDEVSMMKKGAIVLAHMSALSNVERIETIAKAGLTVFAMDLMPRISRAQSMDVLSSQSNLAGYKAVIDAAGEYNGAMPMMMTAAGTVAPARVLVLGAGVAGLQAIATAKRLGAIVHAFDVRPAVKEQVESLGGKFVVVDEEATKDAETAGGYAKEMDDDYKKKQEKAIADQLKKTDIAISTALIPGKPAPILIKEAMLKDMKDGSIVVDLAAEAGGNCEGTKAGELVTKHGVKLMGYLNVPGRLATDASSLFAKNLLNFMTPMIDKENKKIEFNFDDETVSGTCVAKDGEVVHPRLVGEKK